MSQELQENHRRIRKRMTTRFRVDSQPLIAIKLLHGRWEVLRHHENWDVTWDSNVFDMPISFSQAFRRTLPPSCLIKVDGCPVAHFCRARRLPVVQHRGRDIHRIVETDVSPRDEIIQGYF